MTLEPRSYTSPSVTDPGTNATARGPAASAPPGRRHPPSRRRRRQCHRRRRRRRAKTTSPKTSARLGARRTATTRPSATAPMARKRARRPVVFATSPVLHLHLSTTTPTREARPWWGRGGASRSRVRGRGRVYGNCPLPQPTICARRSSTRVREAVRCSLYTSTGRYGPSAVLWHSARKV